MHEFHEHATGDEVPGRIAVSIEPRVKRSAKLKLIWLFREGSLWLIRG